MSSQQHQQTYESAYAQFAWGVMCARPAIEALLRLADGETEERLDVASPQSTEEAIVGMIAAAGQSVRREVNAIVAHNAVGAALQIVYSLFETYVASLGLKPGVEVRAGATIGSECFGRLLWAGRSAFAHGDEWRRKGAVHPLGSQAFSILLNAGIEDPANANLAEVYALLSDGTSDVFFDRLFSASREVGEAAPIVARDSGAGSVILVIGLVLIALGVDLFRKFGQPTDATVLMQIGEGDEAATVPVAAGKIGHPWQLVAVLREEAVKRLSPRAAAPYVEFDARVQAWFVLLDVLLKTDVASSGYHCEMMDLCDGAMDLYRRRAALPNPLQRLAVEREAISKTDFHRLIIELLEARGYTPHEYHETRSDLKMLSDSLIVTPLPEQTETAEEQA